VVLGWGGGVVREEKDVPETGEWVGGGARVVGEECVYGNGKADAVLDAVGDGEGTWAHGGEW
jgi:hypothetical protein